MDERSFRRATAYQNRAQDRGRSPERGGSLRRRPDRVALWAVAMGLVVMIAAAASADGQSGGVSGGAETTAGECVNRQFGSRPLALGDCGGDVRTLNWILKSKRFEKGVSFRKQFESPTDSTVRAFERRKGLPVDGTVELHTRRELVRSMGRQKATWYGPGFFGSRTACGKRLRRKTIGVAHRRLPCGSRVVIRYKGKFLRTRVIDRGPYAHGAKWDLTRKAARKLNFKVTDNIRVARVTRGR
jgi:peptidoglycan hydrolase-like protein with peptidoglycan-binding domain